MAPVTEAGVVEEAKQARSRALTDIMLGVLFEDQRVLWVDSVVPFEWGPDRVQVSYAPRIPRAHYEPIGDEL